MAFTNCSINANFTLESLDTRSYIAIAIGQMSVGILSVCGEPYSSTSPVNNFCHDGRLDYHEII